MHIYPTNKIYLDYDLSNRSSRSSLNTIDLDDDICSICLDSIYDNISLPCNHIFHISCIINWINTQLNKNYIPSCPLCKNEYNLSQFIQKIIQNYIIQIEVIIAKLDFLLYNAILSKSQKNYILTLKRTYSKSKIQIRKAIDQKYFYLLKQKIYLPDDIILLISDTETKLIANIKNKIENQNDKITLQMVGYIRKPFIQLKYLNKYFRLY